MKINTTLFRLALGAALVLVPVAARAQDDAGAGASETVLQGGVSYTESPMLQGGVSYNEGLPALQAQTPLYDNSLTGGEPSPVLDEQGGVEPATSSSSRWSTADCWGVILPRSGGSSDGDGGSSSSWTTEECWGVVLQGNGPDGDSAPEYAQPLSSDEAEQALTGTGKEGGTITYELSVQLALGPLTGAWSPGLAFDDKGGHAFTNSFKGGAGTQLLGASIGIGESVSPGTVEDAAGVTDSVGVDAGEGIQVSVDKTHGSSGDGWSTGAALGFTVGLPVGVHAGRQYTSVFKF